MDLRAERWRLEPTELPRPWRYCVGCREPRAFICTEKFRTNAQKKILDVWLNYRCRDCGEVWKFPVLERRAVAQIATADRDAFERSAPEMVWRHAFDVGRLRSRVIRIDTDLAVRIERRAAEEGADYWLHLEVAFPCEIRLDRLLCSELELPRSRLTRWHEQDRLIVRPDRPQAFSRRVVDGQRVYVTGELT